MKGLIVSIFGCASIALAQPSKSPLGENGIVHDWSHAVSEAVKIEFLTASSDDIIHMYGKPGTTTGFGYGEFEYMYYCPPDTPELERLLQTNKNLDKARTWLCIVFHFNKDKMLDAVEIRLYVVPEVQLQ